MDGTSARSSDDLRELGRSADEQFGDKLLPVRRRPAPWATETTVTVWVPWLIEIGIATALAWWLWSEFSSDAPHRWWWATGVGAYYALWAITFLTFPFSVRARVRLKLIG
jgi:hypothetical protein